MNAAGTVNEPTTGNGSQVFLDGLADRRNSVVLARGDLYFSTGSYWNAFGSVCSLLTSYRRDDVWS